MKANEAVKFLHSTMSVDTLIAILSDAVMMTEGFLESEIKKGIITREKKNAMTEGAGNMLLAIIAELLKSYGLCIKDDPGKFDLEVDKIIQSILITGLMNHQKMKEKKVDEAVTQVMKRKQWLN